MSCHASYPYPVPHLPSSITDGLGFAPAAEADDQPDPDVLYFQPYIPKDAQNDLFKLLRRELFFYRVQYPLTRRGATPSWLVREHRYQMYKREPLIG